MSHNSHPIQQVSVAKSSRETLHRSPRRVKVPAQEMPPAQRKSRLKCLASQTPRPPPSASSHFRRVSLNTAGRRTRGGQTVVAGQCFAWRMSRSAARALVVASSRTGRGNASTLGRRVLFACREAPLAAPRGAWPPPMTTMAIPVVVVVRGARMVGGNLARAQTIPAVVAELACHL